MASQSEPDIQSTFSGSLSYSLPCCPKVSVFLTSLKHPRGRSLARFSLSYFVFIVTPSVFTALRFSGVYPALVIINLAACRAVLGRRGPGSSQRGYRRLLGILTILRSFAGILPNLLVVYTISLGVSLNCVGKRKG